MGLSQRGCCAGACSRCLQATAGFVKDFSKETELRFLKHLSLALYFVLVVVRMESSLWAQPGSFLRLVLDTGGAREVLHSAVLGVLHV